MCKPNAFRKGGRAMSKGISSHQGRKRSKNRTIKKNAAFLFEHLKTVVDGIAGTFGQRCEVVLHDLRDLKRSIIKIENGQVTGRSAGGSITDQGLNYLKNDSGENLLINYPSSTEDGRFLKSSTFLFRDDEGVPAAAICINFDVTDILNFSIAIDDIFGIPEKANETKAIETFQGDANTTLNEIADKTIRKAGKAIPSMGRNDKIEVIRQLEDQGFFLIKGAIKFIAHKLTVSKFTIYNYLDKVREEKAVTGS
jgi:predicted transcriptional regulator YheO